MKPKLAKVIIIIIFCCLTSCLSFIGYNEYDKYVNIDQKSIKSIKDLNNFIKFIFNRIIDWIKCNIISPFKDEKYKLRNCYTDAIVLSNEVESKLDSAMPGDLGQAAWMLKAGAERQTEDYERSQEAIDALGNAIISSDDSAIFSLSDEVQMDEEALSWRAFLLGETGQMTHNLVNMEICDANGNVKDYMDLAATGLDKQGNMIRDNRTQNNPNRYKKGKDFRWSNRCMNRVGGSFGYNNNCDEIHTDNPLIGPKGKEKYWIVEKPGEDGSGDPQGIQSDLNAFPTSDFSGYNCQFYAKYFCKDGKPDLDNHSDMFGAYYNWPELNCCACGGGSRPVDNEGGVNKHKYEVIYKKIDGLMNEVLDGTFDQGKNILCGGANVDSKPPRNFKFSSDNTCRGSDINNIFGSSDNSSDNKYTYVKPLFNNCLDGGRRRAIAPNKHGIRLPSSAGNEADGIGAYIYQGPGHSHINFCVDDCDKDSDCAGVIYRSRRAVKRNNVGKEESNGKYFDNINMMDLKDTINHGNTQVYQIGDAETKGSCHYIKKTVKPFYTDSDYEGSISNICYDTCIPPITKNASGFCVFPEDYQDKYNQELDNLFNRNFNVYHKKGNIGENNTIILKKLEPNFQNLNSSNTLNSNNEILDGNKTIINTEEYTIDYDEPIKSDAFGGEIQTCTQLCDNLENYKVKSGEERTPCPAEGCKRSKCCELHTCGNSDVDCSTTTEFNSCIAPDGTPVRCGPNYSRNDNILCEGTECTKAECCYKSHCSAPADTRCSSSEATVIKQPLYFWELYNRVDGMPKNIIPKNTDITQHTDNHILDKTKCYGPSDLTKAKYKCADHGDSTWKLTPHAQCPEGLSMTQDCTQKIPGTETPCSHYGQFTYSTDPNSLNSVLRCVDDPNSEYCTTGDGEIESSWCTALPPSYRAGPEGGTDGHNVLTTKMNINRYLNDDANNIWNNANAFCNIYRINESTGEVPNSTLNTPCVPNSGGCGGHCGGPGPGTWSSITVPPQPPSDEFFEEFRKAKESLKFS